MWWTNSLCTPANEDLGTLAGYDPLTLFVRATNVVQSFLRPSSIHDQLPHHIALLVCPRFVGLPSQHSSDCLQPRSFLQLFALVCGCSLFPMDSHVLRHCFSSIKVCHRGHFVPKSRVSHTHDCSCSPSHLSPCLHLKDLLPSRILLSSPLFIHRSRERDHGGQVLFNLQNIHLHEKR